MEQLCDGDRLNPDDISNQVPNMQVINPTTPANYFHALRRQVYFLLIYYHYYYY
jgi:2-oxoglutarate dehydrogenase complex dehydrogenase (E1) component-like enzyme